MNVIKRYPGQPQQGKIRVHLRNEHGQPLLSCYDTLMTIKSDDELFTTIQLTFNERNKSAEAGDICLNFSSVLLDSSAVIQLTREQYQQDTCLESLPTDLYFFKFTLHIDYANTATTKLSIDPAFKSLIDHLVNSHPLNVYFTGTETSWNNVMNTMRQIGKEKKENPFDKCYNQKRRAYGPDMIRGLPEDSEPDILRSHMPARNCFHNKDHYLTIQALAIQREHDMAKRRVAKFCSRKHKMVALQIKGCGEREYQVFLPPALDDETKIQVGDVIKIRLPGQFWGSAWRMTVSPLPQAPQGYLSGHMLRPGTLKAGPPAKIVYDTYPLSAIEANQDNITEAILKDKGIEVDVDIDVGGLLERVYRSMECMKTGVYENTMMHDVEKLLICHSLHDIGKYDIFRRVRSEYSGNPEAVITNMNEEQMSVVRMGKAAMAGIVPVQGPPGTGKTHLAINLMNPFIMSKKSHLVLATTQTNSGTDHLARLAQRHIEHLGKLHPDRPWIMNKYVARAQVKDAERAVYLRQTRRQTPSGNCKNTNDITETQKEALTLLKIASLFAEPSSSIDSKSQSPIAEEDIKDSKLSIGHRMLEISGVLSTGPKLVDLEKYERFRTIYDAWSKGREMEKGQLKSFAELAEGLHDFVLQNAAVVCTTVANTGSPTIRSNLANKVALVIADEMPRVREPEALMLFMNRMSPDGYIIIGDIDQLGPYVASSEYDGFSMLQLDRSLQHRWQNAGVPFAFLRVQHRMDPALSKVTSEVVYGSRLLDHESTLNRELALQVKTFNMAKFGIATNKLTLDLSMVEGRAPSETVQAINMSRYNEFHVMYAVNLAEMLSQQFPKASIAILTGYQAQYHLLRAAKQNMITHQAPHENIHIHKVDTAQGLEFDIVIFDQLFLLRDSGSGSAGFMRDADRLNVATSRARHAMYVLVDMKIYYEIPSIGDWGKENHSVHAFMAKLKVDKFEIPLHELERLKCKYYTPERVDPKTGTLCDQMSRLRVSNVGSYERRAKHRHRNWFDSDDDWF